MQINEYLDHLNEIDEHAARFREQIGCCTITEFRLMDLAARHKGFRLGDFGIERSVYQQGIGRIAHRLEDRGFIEIVTDDSDGRAKNLNITKSGKALIGRCREVLSVVIN